MWYWSSGPPWRVPWGMCRVQASGWAAYSALSTQVTLAWQCLQMTAIRGGGSGTFQPKLEVTGFWQLGIQTEVVG